MRRFEFEHGSGQHSDQEGTPKLTLEKLLSDIQPENLHGEQEWGPPVGNEEF